MIRRFLCRLGLHFYAVVHDGRKFVSSCNWCGIYEKGYEP